MFWLHAITPAETRETEIEGGVAPLLFQTAGTFCLQKNEKEVEFGTLSAMAMRKLPPFLLPSPDSTSAPTTVKSWKYI